MLFKYIVIMQEQSIGLYLPLLYLLILDFDTCDYPCIAVYKPVCGTDGRTYSNSCELSKATCKSKGKIQFEHEGKCFGGSVDFLGTGF